jgi:flagellar biosynthesis/type III secretory pathway ATPase
VAGRDVIARGTGCVVRTLGETVVAALPGASVGAGVVIRTSAGASLSGEIAAVERARVAIAPFGPLGGIAVGDRVTLDPAALTVPLGFRVLGRALDATGAPLDGRGPLYARAVTGRFGRCSVARRAAAGAHPLLDGRARNRRSTHDRPWCARRLLRSTGSR